MEADTSPSARAVTKHEEAISALQNSLEQVGEWLRHNTAKEHVYRIVSSTEGLLALDEFSHWIESGHDTKLFKTDPDKLRAFIYHLGRGNADLRAYRAVSASISLQLIDVALSSLRQRKLSVLFAMLRGVIERTATSHLLIRNVFVSLDKHQCKRNSVLGEQEAAHVIARALWGTKVNWHGLELTPLEGVTSKHLKYQPEKDRLDITARQILNAIDSLDDCVSGTRTTYELLCEFLHPNVGDIFGVMTASKTFRDRFGTLHAEIEIRRERTDFDLWPSNSVTEAIRIATRILLLKPDTHIRLKALNETFRKRTTKIMRSLIKKNRILFHRNDLCPCHSGKSVIACCGKPGSASN